MTTDCPICYNEIKETDMMKYSCGHEVCLSCFITQTYTHINYKCCLCRMPYRDTCITTDHKLPQRNKLKINKFMTTHIKGMTDIDILICWSITWNMLRYTPKALNDPVYGRILKTLMYDIHADTLKITRPIFLACEYHVKNKTKYRPMIHNMIIRTMGKYPARQAKYIKTLQSTNFKHRNQKQQNTPPVLITSSTQ